ncbi:MAG: hypothetical protein AB8G22_19285 [Saprospiraceae bacterium]
MKNLFFLSLILLFTACSSSVLNKEYSEITYKNAYKNLFADKELAKADAVLINYAILREGENLEGKTFGEIKQLAEKYRNDGRPEAIGFNTNSPSTKIVASTENEGMGLVRDPNNEKRMTKKIKFSCTYSNPTDKLMAIENTTFVMRGPLKDHITTVAYEVNCKVAAGEELTVFFVADSRNIRDNLMHNAYTKQTNIMFDEWAGNISIQASGIGTTAQSARSFSDCLNDGARREPFFTLKFSDLKDARMGGKTYYDQEMSDEPVKM